MRPSSFFTFSLMLALIVATIFKYNLVSVAWISIQAYLFSCTVLKS